MQTADVICPYTQTFLHHRHPTEASFEYFEQNPISDEADGNSAINFTWSSVYFSGNESKAGVLEEHTG